MNQVEGFKDTSSVFVGNLPWRTTDDELYAIMICAGPIISCVIQRHDHSSRSKGWGLVTFLDHATAQVAVNQIDGMEIEDRKLHVRLDRSAMDSVKGYVVYLGNIPWNFTDKNISDLFLPFRSYYAHVMRNMAGRSRGFGLAKFFDGRDALQAIRSLNGKIIEGRIVECRMNRENVSRSYNARERNTIIVRFDSESINKSALHFHFAVFGEIISIDTRNKYKALIEFANRTESINALALHGSILLGSFLDVKLNRK